MLTILFILYTIIMALVILFIILKCLSNYYINSSGNLFMKLQETPEKSPEEIESIMKKSLYESEKELEEDVKYDVVIIGSGISASVSANILSRAGKKVLMLEKHDRLGGYGHSFEEGDFEFCAGVHFLCQYDDDSALPFLMTFMSDNQFNVFQINDKMIEHYELGGTDVKIKGGELKVFEDTLFLRFPEEKESLKKYFKLIRYHSFSLQKFVGFRNIPWFFRLILKYFFCYDDSCFHEYGRKTTREVLNECGVKNEALRYLLMTNQLLFNSIGDDHCCFPMQAAVSSTYNHKSVPVGGCKKLVESIITNLKNESLGICNCEVKRIIFNKKLDQAKGVELSNGQKIMCDTIISSTGLENTLNLINNSDNNNKEKEFSFVSENHGQTFSILNRLLKKHRKYNGKIFTIFMGLDASPEDLGVKGVGCYVYSASDQWDNFEKMMDLSPPDFDGFEECAFVYVSIIDQFCPSTQEEEEQHDDDDDDHSKKKKKNSKTKITIFTLMNDEWFKPFEGTKTKCRGSDYLEIKNNFTDLILEKIVYKRFPKMEEYVRIVEAGTTLTFQEYGSWPEGSSYGLAVTYDKLCDFVGNKEVENPCKGLYLVGQDVFGPGVGMAVLSTFGALGKILNRNLFLDYVLAKRVFMKKKMEDMRMELEREKIEKKEL